MKTYWWWNKDFAAKGWKCSWQIFVEGRGKIFKKMREWLCWLARWEFFRGLFCLGTVQRALCGKRARILPHPRKQSTGLFVSRCGESGLFESRHSVKNKKLFHQTVKELFVVGVTGFEPTASWSQTKRATNCATPRKKIRSNFAAAVVGDERIELPQTESESVALPLCKSPLHVC